MIINIISIFPKMFKAITEYGLTRKAIQENILKINLLDLRNYSNNKYRNVDDKPYGGGPGMLLSPIPLKSAITCAKKKSIKPIKVIYLSPQGKKINNKKIFQLIKNKSLILVCGRYEGIDERIIITEIDEEISIGDYVLSGGELAAMVLIDVITRFIPGVIKKKISLQEESFIKNRLDYPQYTRPQEIWGIKVPKILLSGNHQEIKKWKKKKSLQATWIKKPELLKKIKLNKQEKKIIKKLKT
ncbi:tRNA (guanosine(37)-N1)-methyltransferase TrmD [Buchnera aphidicola (Kurisakia onigurumii)]|uniref:tRNA (guanosine(37)-N1)-methyltransferase TrmD n=1 Tax=Buchnera aphidicola TaxID=9 RepID=UPI0031B7375D